MRTIRLAFCVITAAAFIFSCKKKHDEVNPLTDGPVGTESPQQSKVYNVRKFYSGTDSLNPELILTLSYDDKNKIKTSYSYDDIGPFEYYKSDYSYSGDTMFTSNFFLDREDKKLYNGSWDTTIYNAAGDPVRNYSSAMLLHTLVEGGSEPAVHNSTSYFYSGKDSLIAEIKFAGFGRDRDNLVMKYTYNSSGNLDKINYSNTPEEYHYKYTTYVPNSGKFSFLPIYSAIGPMLYLSPGELPAELYNNFGEIKYFWRIKWTFDSEERPVFAVSTDHENKKMYYRFEY